MKPNYKNWVPKKMIAELFAGAAVSLALALFFALAPVISSGILKIVLVIIFAVLALVFIGFVIWAVRLYKAFDYNGDRQLSRHIIEGVASHIGLPEGGKVLDVGCGSGALAIAAAKRNPKAEVTGIDRWGKDYSSFSRNLCEQNAEAEGVSNVCFIQGNALKIDFPDETFDAVTSNYVYHNIFSKNRQEILMETLRTLKKGGTFVIHDIFSASKYGDMQAFVRKLKDMGYQKAELIDTTNGMFMSRPEARWMGLSGSALFIGVK